MKNINILKRNCHIGINVVFLEVILKLYDVGGIKGCHTKYVTLLAFLTTYFDGNFFWKEVPGISMIFCGHKHIIITHCY
jgi:hypothetical protein